MLVVNCALKQDRIIQIAESINKPKFTFVKKQGIQLYFNVDEEFDTKEAITILKKHIREDKIGKTLLFMVKEG